MWAVFKAATHFIGDDLSVCLADSPLLGSIRVNHNFQIIDSDRRPIPRLFAAGEAVNPPSVLQSP